MLLDIIFSAQLIPCMVQNEPAVRWFDINKNEITQLCNEKAARIEKKDNF